jgi:hypothetical protein
MSKDATTSYLNCDFVCNPEKARSDYRRCGTAKGEIVEGCWIMPDRGFTDTAAGFLPTLILAVTVVVLPSITDALSPSKLAT